MISVRKKGEGQNSDHEPNQKVYDFRLLALYVIKGGEDDKKVLYSWAAGCNSEDVQLAIYEAEATQMLNTRSKDKTYHLVVSFRPEDEEKLTEASLRDIEQEFAKALGFENHQRICGVHTNTSNTHMHIAYNKIDPEKLISLAPSHDYPKRDAVCRAMEQKYGLKIDLGMEDKANDRQSAGAKTMEVRSGLESLESYGKRHAEDICDRLTKAKNWQDVHQAFALYGLEIKPSGNGFAVHDKYGKHKVKASSLDRNLSKKHLEEKYSTYEAPAAKEYEELEKYQERPIQPASTPRDQLFAAYKERIDAKYERIKEIKEQTRTQIEAVEAEYDKACGELIFKQMLSHDRKRLIKQFRTEQKQEIRAIRAAANEQKEALNTETPFANWIEYLQYEARHGNTAALFVLRSRTRPIKNISAARENQKLVQAFKDELLEEIQQEQLEILAQDGLLTKDRNQILNMLKLQEYAVYSGEIADILDLPFEVDGKGTVIYTLENGGKIRDDGQKVHFSAHDAEAVKLKTLVEIMEARKQMQKEIVNPKISKNDQSQQKSKSILR